VETLADLMRASKPRKIRPNIRPSKQAWSSEEEEIIQSVIDDNEFLVRKRRSKQLFELCHKALTKNNYERSLNAIRAKIEKWRRDQYLIG